jgi:hypothetical protein
VEVFLISAFKFIKITKVFLRLGVFNAVSLSSRLNPFVGEGNLSLLKGKKSPPINLIPFGAFYTS